MAVAGGMDGVSVATGVSVAVAGVPVAMLIDVLVPYQLNIDDRV